MQKTAVGLMYIIKKYMPRDTSTVKTVKNISDKHNNYSFFRQLGWSKLDAVQIFVHTSITRIAPWIFIPACK